MMVSVLLLSVVELVQNVTLSRSGMKKHKPTPDNWNWCAKYCKFGCFRNQTI